MIALLGNYALIAQKNDENMTAICNDVKKGKTTSATEKFDEIKNPDLTDTNTRYFVVHAFVKASLLKNEEFSEINLQNALDTVIMTAALFKSFPDKSFWDWDVAFMKKDTKHRVNKECPAIDIDGKSLAELENYLRDTLEKGRNGSLNKILRDSLNGADGEASKALALKIKTMERDDSVRVIMANEKMEKMKILLGDELGKSTIRKTMKDMKANKSESAKDSVSVNFKVYDVDSIQMEVYLVCKHQPFSGGVVSETNEISEYCNEKVSSMIKNGVSDVTRRWFSLYGKDTLNVSTVIVGEADDVWKNKGKLQTFLKDCNNIGPKIKVKLGDKISNEQIAMLRALSAEVFLKVGIKNTENAVSEETGKKVYVNLESPILVSKDWLKEGTGEEGAYFRKETILMKCNCN